MRFESLKVSKRIVGEAKLIWRLYKDPRTPGLFKLLAWLLLLYLLTPVDVLPDFIPVLGQLDDLLIVLVGCKLLVRLCPQDVVEEHRALLRI